MANFFRRKKICHSEYRGCLNPHFLACYSESMSTSTPPVRPGPYAIVGAAKYKTMKGITYHVLRLGSESHGDGVDPSRSHLNIYEGAQDYDELRAAVKARIATTTRKPRPDANRLVELMLTSSAEFFEGKSREEQLAYLRDSVDFAKSKLGAANVVSVSYHFDEGTPHAHVLAVPIVTRARTTKVAGTSMVTTLDAQRVLGGPLELEQLWTDFAAHVQARGHAVNRGVSKAEKASALQKVPKRKTVRQWWIEQVAEVDAMHAATIETLADAATEAKAAAEIRRSAQREAVGVLQKLTVERSAVASHALAVYRAQQRQQLDLDVQAARLDHWHNELERESFGLGLAAKRPALAPNPMAPGASAPGSPGRTAWEPSAPGFG